MLTPLEMTGAGWTYMLRIPVSKFPLEEGGRPKAGGWIRLAEAGAATQGIRTNPINPSCAFGAALLQAMLLS